MTKSDNILEIVLITYNRSKSLEKTLLSIVDGFLINIKVTILDNCSEDDTESICRVFIDQHKNISYVKNKYNIGGCANAMRAYEIASAEYIWIICDDDICNFSSIKDVIYLINKYSPDLLIVGSAVAAGSIQSIVLPTGVLLNSTGGNTGAVVFNLTFLPSSIVKLDKLRGIGFEAGYKLIDTYFPQCFWISCFINEEWNFIITKKILVQRPNSSSGFSNNFLHINGFLRATSAINNTDKVNQICDTYFNESLIYYLKTIASSIVRLRAIDKDIKVDLLVHIWHTPNIARKVLSIVLLPLVFLPKAIALSFFCNRKY